MCTEAARVSKRVATGYVRPNCILILAGGLFVPTEVLERLPRMTVSGCMQSHVRTRRFCWMASGSPPHLADRRKLGNLSPACELSALTFYSSCEDVG